MKKIKANFQKELAYVELAQFLKDYIDDNTIIICIGTDRCIGDSLGPIVGSMLINKFFPLTVYGTIKTPIHALNLENQLKLIKEQHSNNNIIAIYACLGDDSSRGEMQVRTQPISPGKGVGKTLPDVGNISIIGIVDSCDNTEFFTNKSTRLDLIIDMSSVIVNTILYAYCLNHKDNGVFF